MHMDRPTHLEGHDGGYMLDHARDLEDQLVRVSILLRNAIHLDIKSHSQDSRCAESKRYVTLSVSWRLAGSDTAALGMYVLPSHGEQRKGQRREACEPDRSECVEAFNGAPGVALLLDHVLHIPRCHVDGESWRAYEHRQPTQYSGRRIHTITSDVRVCVRLRDVSAGLTDDEPKLNWPRE